MKVSGLSVVLVLAYVVAAHGFTDFLRFGTNAARGAVNGAAQVADTGVAGFRGVAQHVPLGGHAANAAQSAVNAANQAGQSALNRADQAISLGSLMTTILSNPILLQIITM